MEKQSKVTQGHQPDLTAAFDTMDHDLLLLRLERQFGLRSVTMLWFRSYLCGRSYRVWFTGAASRTVFVACSVPQGSVLGPRLFIMYSADLADKAEEHDVNFLGYADDTQLYVHSVSYTHLTLPTIYSV